MPYRIEIDRQIALARELRARYHAHLLHQAWAALKRLTGHVVAHAPRVVTHTH
jgi:hypothetical protein